MTLPEPGLDLEAKTLTDMLSLGKWEPHEVGLVERQIRDRRALVAAGLTSSTSEWWTRKLQQQVDPLLRLRWDERQGWVVERAVYEWGCWAICGVLGMRCVPVHLVDILRAGDMQRYNPKEYLAMKRAAADTTRSANDAKGTDKVLAAVDRMSERRVREFVEVERALHTGEKIVAHGETEAMLARMTRASEQAGQTPEPEPVVVKGRVGKHVG
jgi:hypothetical protein